MDSLLSFITHPSPGVFATLAALSTATALLSRARRFMQLMTRVAIIGAVLFGIYLLFVYHVEILAFFQKGSW